MMSQFIRHRFSINLLHDARITEMVKWAENFLFSCEMSFVKSPEHIFQHSF